MVYLRQAKAVSIEGHPTATYNGVYTHDSTHEGWPVLKNDKGNYCYRYTPRDQWRLSDRHRPDEDLSDAYIVAKEGPLPVGARTWQVIEPRDDNPWADFEAERGIRRFDLPGEEWQDATLTVTLQQ